MTDFYFCFIVIDVVQSFSMTYRFILDLRQHLFYIGHEMAARNSEEMKLDFSKAQGIGSVTI